MAEFVMGGKYVFSDTPFSSAWIIGAYLILPLIVGLVLGGSFVYLIRRLIHAQIVCIKPGRVRVVGMQLKRRKFHVRELNLRLLAAKISAKQLAKLECRWR